VNSLAGWKRDLKENEIVAEMSNGMIKLATFMSILA